MGNHVAPHALPDVLQVSTLAQLGAAFDLVRDGRTYSELDRAAKRLPLERGGPQRLPSSTLGDLMKGRTSRSTLETFLAACGVPKSVMPEWLRAWERVRDGDADVPSGSVQIRDAQPRHLGVHAAIDAGTTSGALPAYIVRDIDLDVHGLRARVRAAALHGGFVLVVGASSVGKTRCAYEAVLAELPHWWLLQPADPAGLRALASDPPKSTVVWLDELQRYLDRPDSLDAACVRSLLRSQRPVVLVATLWPDRYRAYTAVPAPDQPDAMGLQRELIELADILYLSEGFTTAETARAWELSESDPAIRAALASGEYGITQALAAAPQLVARWETADPYARAVLSAALDASTLGFRSALPADMLRSAAPGYCDAKTRAAAPANWFEAALAYATALLHGAASALTPVSERSADMGHASGYLIADYLLHRLLPSRRSVRPPASTWEACVRYATDPADVMRLADAAEDRLLFCYAEPLLRRAADLDARNPDGRSNAAWRLAYLLRRQGRIAELTARAEAGDTGAAALVADYLAHAGRTEDALATLRAHGDTSDIHALWLIAEWLVNTAERPHDALAVLRLFTGEGDSYPVRRLADLLGTCGEVEELRRLADTYASASWQLAKVLAARDDTHELALRAKAGDFPAVWWLAEIRSSHRPSEELRLLLDQAPQSAVERYADLLTEHDERELRSRADNGEPTMASRLAQLLGQRGEIEELRVRAQHHPSAAVELAALLARQGELEQLRTLADTGESAGSVAEARLAELLFDRRDEAGLRARIDHGDLNACIKLPELLADLGRMDEADHLRKFGMAADGTPGPAQDGSRYADLHIRPEPHPPHWWCHG